MLTSKSDFGHLTDSADHICTPAKSRKVVFRKWFETVTILTCLIGGGTGLGYIYGTQKADESHAAEISRLQKAYDTNIDYLTYKLGRAAAAVEGAATVAESAANTADSAANTAESAAIDAKRAVHQSGNRKLISARPAGASSSPILGSSPSSIPSSIPSPKPNFQTSPWFGERESR